MDLIAPVGATAAARPLPKFGDGALSTGQSVQARVTRVDGDTVQLRMGDQTVSVASRVPLTVGQQVSLLVEASSAGKMLLRLVDDTSGKGRSGRSETSSNGRTTSTFGTGRGASATGAVPGDWQTPFESLLSLSEREAGASVGGQTSWGGEPDWSEPGEPAARTDNPSNQGRASTQGTPAGDSREAGQSPAGTDAATGAGGTRRGVGTASASAHGPDAAASPASATGSGSRSGILNPVGPRLQMPAGPTGMNVGSGPSVGAGPSAGAGTNLGTGPLGQPGAASPGSATMRPANFTIAQPGASGTGPGSPTMTDRPGQGNNAGVATGRPWAPGLANVMSGAPANDPLTTMLFEALDGTPAGLAGTGQDRVSDPIGGPAPRFAAPAANPLQAASTMGQTTTRRAPGSNAAEPASTTRGPASTAGGATAGGPTTSPQGPMGQAPGSQGLAARAAMPAYGRLAQSVGGAVAFGQLMATLPREIGETLARAPLAPADLGRLLVDVGVHPDEMNAVLVGEMLAQGVPVQEGSVRSLRRELAAAGGSHRDAAPAVALARLGLPITPLSLAVARQLQAGQLDPPAAWGDLLPELQELARSAGQGSQAGALASELLADWRVPVHDGANAIAAWLRTSVDRLAIPLESKLVRSLTPPAGDPARAANDQIQAAGDQERAGAASSGEPARSSALLVSPGESFGPAVTPGQDVRARLDLLGQALPPSTRGEHDSLSYGLQRLQATIQAEQILNGGSVERAEPRFFAVTLPTVMERQTGTLQIRVRERDAQPRRRGDAGRPDIVQLKLSLPGLGDLGVNLTIGQQSVACHFAAGTSFTEALLNASSGELVNRLKRIGFANPAVDAAREALESAAPIQAAVPRVGHVDLSA